MMKWICTLLSFSLIHCVYGQNITLMGTVEVEVGKGTYQPIANAQITIDGSLGEAISDKNGHFSLTLSKTVKNGQRIGLTCESKGYKQYNKYIVASSENIYKITLIPLLKPTDLKDIRIECLDIKQTLPTSPPKIIFNNSTFYCEQLQLQLLISLNSNRNNSVHLRNLSVEVEKVKEINKNLLPYTIDVDSIIGYGIVKVDEYIVDISDSLKINVNYIKNKSVAVPIDPNSLLNIGNEIYAFDLNSIDSFLQKKINIQVRTPGVYRVRFKINYNTFNNDKLDYSPWVNIVHK